MGEGTGIKQKKHMEIQIPLPQSFSINTYKELKNYLKQLELSIHHAQKAVENAEKEGLEVTEDAYVDFMHNGIAKETSDDLYEGLQNISIRISLQ